MNKVVYLFWNHMIGVGHVYFIQLYLYEKQHSMYNLSKKTHKSELADT